MEIEYHIKPRQSGKTTTAYKIWEKNKTESMLLVRNINEISRYNNLKFEKNILSLDSIKIENFRGVKPKILIIDEYDGISIQKMIIINDIINRINSIEKVIVFTTQYLDIIIEIYYTIRKLKNKTNIDMITKICFILFPEIDKIINLKEIINIYYHHLMFNKNTNVHGKISFTTIKKILNTQL